MDLKIKSHARKRYIERIRQPDHYKHLSNCKKVNCPECAKLNDDLEAVARNFGRKIDREIADLFRQAKANNWLVKDASFIDAIRQKYGEIGAGRRCFYRNGDIVYVTVEDEPIPILITILNVHMIEGTVIDAFAGTEKMNDVFARWKFQARQKRS